MAGSAPPSPPAKSHRSEAHPVAIDCPSCGGPITLRTFSTVRHVACRFCGSELSPDEHGALRLAVEHARKQFPAVLPLYARGTFDGTTFEIVGIVRRCCKVEGRRYYWQEFLLFHPYEGYRWLIYGEDHGHWSLGEALDGAPIPTSVLPGRADGRGDGVLFADWRNCLRLPYANTTYRHFQSVTAETVYVSGEFPWRVRVGDRSEMHDFVAPPFGLSVEENTLDGDLDLTFTRTRYVTPKAVFRAFERKEPPPPTTGVAPTQPNPYAAQKRFFTLSTTLFLLLWAALSAFYVVGRDTRRLWAQAVPLEPVTQAAPGTKAPPKTMVFQPFTIPLDLSDYDHPVPLEVRFSASPLSNTWAYADMMLVDEAAGEALGFSAEVDEWHGVSGGEAWQEGTKVRTIVLPALQPGRYRLQVAPQAQRRRDGTFIVRKAHVTVDADPLLLRYVLLPLPLILIVPFVRLLRRWSFEVKRWAESDHPIVETE